MRKLADKSVIQDKLIDQYKLFISHLNGHNTPSLQKIREEGIIAFEEVGLPTTKNEEWKYTNLNPILKHDFKHAFKYSAQEIDLKELPQIEKDINRIVLVNGFYSDELSEIKEDKTDLIITSLRIAQKKYPDLVNAHLGKYTAYQENGLWALNTAFLQDGIFIHVPKNAKPKKPVQIIYVNDCRKENYLIQPRNLILVDQGAEVQITESFHTLGDHYSFLNVASEIMVAENASLTQHKLQADKENAFEVCYTQVIQKRDSHFKDTKITTGGSFVRNDLRVESKGPNSSSNLYGLYLLDNKQFADNHTVVDHKVPDCVSNELYKGVLDDKSVGVFNGKVYVRPDAQKVNAFQANRNILLSDEATINTKPQLEIWADDVKCSHGATSGQLNEEEVFYLQSRGIDKDQAKSLLVYAFAGEVIEYIQWEPLKEIVIKIVAEKLKIEI